MTLQLITSEFPFIQYEEISSFFFISVASCHQTFKKMFIIAMFNKCVNPSRDLVIKDKIFVLEI
jgi:hypothetical protein